MQSPVFKNRSIFAMVATVTEKWQRDNQQDCQRNYSLKSKIKSIVILDVSRWRDVYNTIKLYTYNQSPITVVSTVCSIASMYKERRYRCHYRSRSLHFRI